MKKKVDIVSEITQQEQYESLKNQLKRDWRMKNKLTLCIDIENVLLAKLDLNDENDVQKLYSYKDLIRNFIIIRKDGVGDPKECSVDTCSKRIIKGYCVCKLMAFNIRPHSFELVGAIQPFFEVVATSHFTFRELKQIVDQIEKVLNNPIIEQNKRTIQRAKELKNSGKKNGDRIGRFRPKLLKKKLYFQYMICHQNYTYFEELGEYIENLHILTQNRDPAKIFNLNSSQQRLVACMD